MAVFVTGASGFIGQRLCTTLLNHGYEVVASSRGRLQFENANLKVVKCDVCMQESLRPMEGADCVFHLASHVGQWSKDGSEFQRVNVDGTRNVLEAAEQYGVEKVVIVSSAGVYGPGRDGDLLNEDSPKNSNGKTEYEKTKWLAEQLALEFARQGNVSVCVAQPSRVFGPGVLSESNAITKIVRGFLNRRIQLIPAVGRFVGNYVCVDTVVDGLIRIMQFGKDGRSYILGGENLTFASLFQIILEETGNRNWLIPVPLFAVKSFAYWQLAMAKTFSVQPILIPAFVDKYASHNALSSSRAVQELGYQPTDVRAAIASTVRWLQCEQFSGESIRANKSPESVG